MTEKIELKSIEKLLGMIFFIPSYQRGYRWTEQQVKDLLNDIDDFIKDKKSEGFYCIQPLVIKKINENNWEVIDGQQRLTTILILLSELKIDEKYSIEYETRSDSSSFLQNIEDTKKTNNIDYYHIYQAKETIEQWLGKTTDEYKKSFKDTLLKNVQFIWYESENEDSIKVFTRLNIGKISLTNAELIKALFLNRSNFKEKNNQSIRLKQQEIASQWDNIEYTLQNDEFWLFLNKPDYDKPTRIDFIFDLVCKQEKLGIFENIGSDKYKTFRYFYEYFKTKKNDSEQAIKECWHEVKTIFQTFNEWYNDLELYHYVGYLIDRGEKIDGLLKEWNAKGQTKESFVSSLKEKIKGKLSNCNDLDKEYEINGNPKTQCKPLLLLHNIQTVINQNKNYEKKSSYGLKAFYKFPFHLYKLENWDVEHIDSNTENELNDKNEQNEYLLNIYNAVSKEQQGKIAKFINDADAKNFDELKAKDFIPKAQNQLSQAEKNQIMNFTLLDSSTNRSYGNSIFSAKRRIIIGKDKGKLIAIPKIGKKDGKPCLIQGEEIDALTSFIPPCTKQIFLKYYSSTSSSPNNWEKSDAEAYRNDIYETLKDFGVTLSKETEKTSNEQ